MAHYDERFHKYVKKFMSKKTYRRCAAFTVSPPPMEVEAFKQLADGLCMSFRELYPQDIFVMVVEVDDAGRLHLHGTYAHMRKRGLSSAQVLESVKDSMDEASRGFWCIKPVHNSGWYNYMFKDTDRVTNVYLRGTYVYTELETARFSKRPDN